MLASSRMEDATVDTNAGAPRVYEARCTRCGRCVQVCEAQVLELGSRVPLVVHPERCGGCGLCEEVCPEGAIDCEFEIVW